MNTNLQIIRAACIAANPEIVELRQVGCLVEYDNFTWRYLYTNGFTVIIQSFHFNTQEEVSIGKVNVLGRPIRLADVLLAIGKDEVDLPVNFGATIPKWKIIHSDITGSSEGWNLRTDDLTLQSPETLEFLANLLK